MSQAKSTSITDTPVGSIPPVITYAPSDPTAPQPQPWLTLAAQTRIWSGVIFSFSASMLGLGAWMKPSPHGLGTHAENLGLPPCGFYHTFGIPCPTCGCTTAVTWLAHGHVAMAFFVQPFGAVVGLLGVAGLILSVIGLFTGRWRGPQPSQIKWHTHRILLSGLAFLLAAWIYKIIMVRLGYC